MKTITHCRACGSTALTRAFSLSSVIEQSGRRRIFSGPRHNRIEYLLCDPARDAHACGLVQRAAGGDEEGPFAPSGAYRANRSHQRAIATEALELISGRDCAALDIGCADGALLSYYPRWVERYGVDHGDRIAEVGPWANTLKAEFPSAEFDRAYGDKRFDIITAVSVLEDVDEPRAFLARMKSLLAEDGVIVIEALYAPMTMTQNLFEAAHERRRAFYSLAALERLFRDCDLKIFRGALSDKNGGSLRLFATHTEVDAYDFDPWYERLARLWDEENALALRSLAPYQAFEGRVEELKVGFQELMLRAKKRGETVHLIGDGPATVELYGWADEPLRGERGADAIEATIAPGEPDPNARLGRKGPPVISEAASRAVEPTYIIAPSSLRREMLERWREAIMRGAQLVFVAPRLTIVHAGNFSAEFGKSLSGGDTAGSVETLRAILNASGGPRLVAVNDQVTKSA